MKAVACGIQSEFFVEAPSAASPGLLAYVSTSFAHKV